MVRTWGPEGPRTARGRSTPPVVAVVLALALTILAPPTAAAADTSPGPDPLGPQQWYLSWKEGGTSPEDGRGTVVGVIDTGIDSTHPDLDDAYDAALSRSFVEDRCSRDPYCTDPGRDLLGHGTAVAGIIAAALDGHGIGGAAPGADLVSLKAGDASGYFSADAVSRAIRYGADAGLDVLVMSFTVDPWFRYCDNAPRDTDEERARQREDRAKVESALQYASDRGVVMVAAAGNESYDLDGGTTDGYNAGHARSSGRSVNGSCVTLPAQSEHVITVGSLDASGVRADYSNVGTAIDIAAPGGEPVWYDQGNAPHGLDSAILTTVPAELLRDFGMLADDGTPLAPGIQSDCSEGVDLCRYYWYESGTSYAAPQVAAAAAILLARGVPPSRVGQELTALASPVQCPAENAKLPCATTSTGTNTWYGHGALRLPRG